MSKIRFLTIMLQLQWMTQEDEPPISKELDCKDPPPPGTEYKMTKVGEQLARLNVSLFGELSYAKACH